MLIVYVLVEAQGLNVGAKKKKVATGPSPQKKATQDYAATVDTHASVRAHTHTNTYERARTRTHTHVVVTLE